MLGGFLFAWPLARRLRLRFQTSRRILLKSAEQANRGSYANHCQGCGHAGDAEPEHFRVLRDSVGVRHSASNQRHAQDVHEPRPGAKIFSEGHEQQGERYVLSKISLDAHAPQEDHVAAIADRNPRTAPGANNADRRLL